jgi:hypothetical protein
VSPSICGHRADGDMLRLVFQQPEQIHAARLKALLAEHLAGFREIYAGSPVT